MIRELLDGPRVDHLRQNCAGRMAACATNLARIRPQCAVSARSQFCAAESGQYAPGPAPARSWIAA